MINKSLLYYYSSILKNKNIVVDVKALEQKLKKLEEIQKRYGE